MKNWPEQDAKAHFNELIAACINEGPQMLTQQGTETAVLMSITEWKRLNAAPHSSLKELLMSDLGRADLDLPARGSAKRRTFVSL